MHSLVGFFSSNAKRSYLDDLEKKLTFQFITSTYVPNPVLPICVPGYNIKKHTEHRVQVEASQKAAALQWQVTKHHHQHHHCHNHPYHHYLLHCIGIIIIMVCTTIVILRTIANLCQYFLLQVQAR